MTVEFTVPGVPVGKGRGAKKASDEQVLAAYEAKGSCKGAADALGMCPQSVHERLKRMGAGKRTNVFSDACRERLEKEYAAHADAGTLDQLAEAMGRTKQFICRKARELGLTDQKRGRGYLAEGLSTRAKERIAKNGHPRGMKGKTHSCEAKAVMSQRGSERWEAMTQDERFALTLRQIKAKVAKGTPVPPRPNASWKAGWREIGGIRKYYRSKWEANYAYYLEWLRAKGEILAWAHEPKTFWFDGIKRGAVSYLPDFCVTETSGAESYHEVKGWMDDRSKTKIKRMAKYHPDVKLIVIDSKAYAALKKTVSRIVPGWEE